MQKALGTLLALLLVAMAGCLGGDDAPSLDSDADGIPDGEEAALGTDPQAPQKSAEAVAFQEALYTYRQQLWSNIG